MAFGTEYSKGSRIYHKHLPGRASGTSIYWFFKRGTCLLSSSTEPLSESLWRVAESESSWGVSKACQARHTLTGLPLLNCRSTSSIQRDTAVPLVGLESKCSYTEIRFQRIWQYKSVGNNSEPRISQAATQKQGRAVSKITPPGGVALAGRKPIRIEMLEISQNLIFKIDQL